MKIVLTGGPSAGKTSLALVLSKTYPEQVNIVPEAASILFTGGFPRRDDIEQLECQQRAIYYVQRELERTVGIESAERTLICDRGSLDALAYWPSSEADFFKSIGSSMEQEISRYQWVIHLETATAAQYKLSKLRTESALEAEEINTRVKHAWRNHPHRIIIPNSIDFPTKIKLALKIVRAIYENLQPEEIRKLIESKA
ncbi:MAG: ATP/GTP-binding protein [Bdellovibrionales bacterium]